MRSRKFTTNIICIIAFGLGWLVQTALAEEVTVTGWFHVVWGEKAYVDVVDDSGKSWVLDTSQISLDYFGGIQALDRARVRVSGERLAGKVDSILVREIQLVERSRRSILQESQQAVTTSKPYATLLCRFADVTSIPQAWPEPNLSRRPELGGHRPLATPAACVSWKQSWGLAGLFSPPSTVPRKGRLTLRR